MHLKLTPPPCSHDDCREPARWQPLLELRSGPRAVPRRLTFLRLGYCDEHRQTLGLGPLLSDEGFAKIARDLREAGREKISRDATTLAWRRLANYDLRRLLCSQDRTSSPRGDDEINLSF